LSTHFEKRDVAFLHILEELRAILLGQTQTPAFESSGGRPIGTIDYIAPEVLCQKDYDMRCDWWSLGVMAYEMLYGVTPFASASAMQTGLKIVGYRSNLNFPSVPKVGRKARDLIRRLLTDADDRLDFEGIQQHPFFAGVNWQLLADVDGPYIPTLKSPDDISAFSPVIDEDEFSSLSMSLSEMSGPPDPQVMKYAFLGFTYKRPKRHVRVADVVFDAPATDS
jgi:serine/threonine protein kinase